LFRRDSGLVGYSGQQRIVFGIDGEQERLNDSLSKTVDEAENKESGGDPVECDASILGLPHEMRFG